jgi:hypothetical protein
MQAVPALASTTLPNTLRFALDPVIGFLVVAALAAADHDHTSPTPGASLQPSPLRDH